nr:MAG TPA: hypothetical protein [Caudoviricetes sp.]
MVSAKAIFSVIIYPPLRYLINWDNMFHSFYEFP